MRRHLETLAEKLGSVTQTGLLSRSRIATILSIVILALATSARTFAQSCSEKNISWPLDANDSQKVSAGPMEYTLLCWNSKTVAVCGVDHYIDAQCPKECQNAQYFGVEVNPLILENLSYHPVIYGSPVYDTCSGKLDNDGICSATGKGKACQYQCGTHYEYNDSCKVEAEKQQALLMQVPGYDKVQNLINIVSDGPGMDNRLPSITCDIVISRPVAKSGKADPPCGSESCKIPVFKTCRSRDFGLELSQPGSCGATAVNRVTPPGTSLADAYAGQNPLLDLDATLQRDDFQSMTPQGTPGPTSLTGEDQHDPNKKASWLRGVLNRYGGPVGAYQAQPALTSQIVSNLKLLLELYGDALQAADREYTESLYSLLPLSVRTDCGVKFVPPKDVPSSCTTVPPINAVMEMCTRMLADHSTPGSVASVFPVCLNVMDNIAALPNECRRDDYIASYTSLAEGLTSKRMSLAAAAAGSTDQIKEIGDKLAALDAWFKKLKRTVYPGMPLDPNFLAQTSRILKAFWKPLYLNKAGGLPVGTAQEAEAARLTVVNDGLIADQQTLKAAYAYGGAGSQPLTSAPLLSLTADALKGIEQRALGTATFHDMVCRFESCAGRVTPTSAFFRVLGSIHSKDQLNRMLDSSVRNAIGPDWSAVFDGIIAGHGAFESAFKDAQGIDPSKPYDEAQLLALPLDQLAVPTKDVAQILRGAHARSRAYDANGLFTLSELKNLKVGLNSEKDDAVAAELNRVTLLLQQSLQAYKDNKLTLVRGLVDQIQNQSTSDSLTQRIQSLMQKVGDLSRDISGLQISSAVDEARYAQFMKGFEGIWATIKENGQPIIVSQGAHDIDVSAADVIPISDRSDISKIAVSRGGNVWKLTKQPGDIVNFYISGRWAPTCALGQLAVNGDQVIVIDTQGQPIFTGPEGYSLQQQAGHYAASSNQTVDTSGVFASLTASMRACAGGFTPAGGAQECLEFDEGAKWSHDQSSTSSDGSETRSTFSYARGIRSPLTPFFNQPVGSLLLVEMPQGSTNTSLVRSLRVLIAPQTSVLVNAQSDYYLVVNDSICAHPSTEPLAVRVTELRSASAASQNMAQAMAAIPAIVRKQGEPIVAQGRILPGQVDQMRLSAYQELYSRCNCTSLSAYPDSLKNLFETYVEKELVGIQREVEMVNIERQVRETMMDVQTLQNELDHAKSAGRLSALIPAWALRNLDGMQLQYSLNVLGQLLTDWIYPIISLRNPETLTNFTSGDRQIIDQLTAISVTDSLDEKAQRAVDAATTIETRLHEARIAAQRPINTVIFSIPKPGITSPTPYWKIDAETATRFWQDILSNKDTTITVKPEYIYTNTDPDYLPCNYSAPIINSVVYYLVYPLPMTYPRTQLTATLSPQMRFPLVPGLDAYQFADPTYLGPFITVLGGGSPSAIDDEINKYWAEPGSQVAPGLSPFTDWHLDLTPFRNEYPSDKPDLLADNNPWKQAVELITAFRVEPRSEAPAQPLPGVATCPSSRSSSGTTGPK